MVNNNYDDNIRGKKLMQNAVSHHLLTNVRPLPAALLGNSFQLIYWACSSVVWNIPLVKSPVSAMLPHSFWFFFMYLLTGRP